MSEFQEKLQTMKESVNSSLDEIQIDIIEDSPNGEVEETPRVQQNEKGHRKRKVKDRLGALIAEKRILEIEKQRLQAYAQDQEIAISELRAKAEQNAHNSNIYYEDSLDNQQKRIRSEIKVAKDEGDTDKEIELQQRMAEIAAKKQTQLLSKSLQQQQPINYQQPYYPEPSFAPVPSHYEEPVNEALEDWLDDNGWADPNSSEFDQQLSAEANDIAAELNENLIANRAGNAVGTPEYYNTISRIMKKRIKVISDENDYNDINEQDNSQYRQNYNNDNAYTVAPVTKRGSSMAEKYTPRDNNISPQRMSLLPVERDIAIKLAPQLTIKYGRHISETEACALYWKEKMKLHPDDRLQPGAQLWER